MPLSAPAQPRPLTPQDANVSFPAMKRNSVWIALLLSAVALVGASCAPPPDMRGNLPEKTTLDQIKSGETDKAAVTKLLGSPSSVATFDSNTWYYISQETQKIAFFKP